MFGGADYILVEKLEENLDDSARLNESSRSWRLLA